jgi:hypothetical protein
LAQGKVFIGTPTIGGVVTNVFAQTLLAATMAATKAGWDYGQAFFDGAGVATARNALANIFLRDKEATHLLFIDSDMGGDVDLFQRLFAFEGPMAGVICAERNLNLDTLMEEAKKGSSRERATALASRFVVALPPGDVAFKNGFCRVESMGLACVLVRRDVFDTLIAKGLARKIPTGRLAAHGIGPEMWDFFSEIEREDGSRLSEDYSFCRRVSEAAFEIWGYGARTMSHVGPFAYGATFLEKVKAHAERKEPLTKGRG